MKVGTTICRILSFGLAAALTLPVVSALAHPTPQTAADHKAMMRDALQESVNQLNLSDDQKSKLKDIFTDAKAKRESIMTDSSLTDDQKKDKMKALHSDTKAKVNEVLTPDQRAQLKEKMDAMKAANQPH